MPANTYTLIEKIVVGAAGASDVTFTSIPQTYTDLKIVISARGTFSATYNTYVIRFNGSTTGYSLRQLYGNGSAATSTSGTSVLATDAVGATATANTFSNTELYIPNYTGSNNKSMSTDTVTENNATEAWTELYANLWSNSSAITSISFIPNSGTFTQYSTFYLYGIAKEGVSPSPSSAPYATGGDRIVFDGTYWYHAFTSSGTFTPRKGLSCDVLVVAGGGGGGGSSNSGFYAAGGGAGGVIAFASQSLASNTGYSATIGAGGAGGLSPSATRGSNGTNSSFASLTAAVGGGGGGGGGDTTSSQLSGANGGSGGGSNSTSGTPGTGTSGQGNAGGQGAGTFQVTTQSGGGGGGAGGAGGAAPSNVAGGAGGAGTNSVTNWGALSAVLTATGLGVSGYIAGGAGGNGNTSGGAAGSGGGGAGASGGSAGGVGVANTGSGGGATSAGGSGIVIIRYAA